MKASIMALAAMVGILGFDQALMAKDLKVAVVQPGTTDVHKARIISGGWVTISASGDGDTDLDLYVYDPYGRLVGYDDDQTDDCVVRFHADFTAKYTIKVVNRSNTLANKYVIAID